MNSTSSFDPFAPVVVSATEDGKILEVNKSFTEICGFSQEEVISKKVSELNLWPDPSKRDAFVDRVKKGEEVINEKVVIRTKSGREIDVVFSMLALHFIGSSIIVTIARTAEASSAQQLTECGQPDTNLNSTARQPATKVALPTIEGLLFIKIADILYLKASGNYTEIFLTGGKKHVASRQLHEYENLLRDHNFFRIHHSILVQLDFIEKYVRGDGGYVVIADNTSLLVSRRKRDAFLNRVQYTR